MVLGCGGKTSATGAGSAGDVAADALEVRAGVLLGSQEAKSPALPPRPDVVELADRLAVLGARAADAQHGAHLTRLAADLRAKSFRLRHIEADAREAVELYQQVSRTRGSEACGAARSRAVLAAELAQDPAALYRDAYVALASFDDARCRASLESLLRSAGAYRPGNDALRTLDAEARAKDAGPVSEGVEEGRLSGNDAGIVVSPVADGAEPSARTHVRSILPYGSTDRARIVVTLSGASPFEVADLAGEPANEHRGPRLVVDIARAHSGRARDIAVGGLVERVRVAPRGEGTRVVLDLAATAYRRVFYLPEPFRVVIDVATHPPEAKPATGSERAVMRVAIDPGHGGSDAGAIGPTGLREKDVTLDIAHRVAPVLARELGILTMLTRDGDRFVGLDERTARANAFHADLFVSIHCNAAPSESARGVMSFVLDSSKDDVALKIAARENATSTEANPAVMSIAHDLRVADLGNRSTRLAELLQRTTMASLTGAFGDTPDQGVKTAGFFVLVGAEMPSVLWETSFISNPTDEARLGRAEFRQRLADAVVNAVKAFREGR